MNEEWRKIDRKKNRGLYIIFKYYGENTKEVP